MQTIPVFWSAQAMDKMKMDALNIPAEPTLAQTPETVIHSEPVPPPQAYPAQRRHPRVRCFLAVQLRPADDQNLLVGKLSDVSLGGCGIESPTPVKSGSQVALCPLAAAGALWVEGIVVNTRLAEGATGYHIGVRFHDEDAPTHNVKEFVRFVEEASAKQRPSNFYLNRLVGGQT
jgi:c-di-GMP-binding flagellar brake protein YcgR